MNRRQLLYGAGAGLFMAQVARARDADPMIFRSVYANHDVTLQTDPNSAFWRSALPIYAEVDNYGKPIPTYRTEVHSRWTTRDLYLLFVCPYEELYLKPNPKITTETFELWNWDVAELFISSDFQNIRRYKEFELSPQGEWIDVDVNLDLPDHTVGWTWNSGLQVAAHIDPATRTWYGAMRIPFSAIDSRMPRKGHTFRANFLRSQGPPNRRKAIAWKAPMSDSFHKPERFGLLELVEEK